MTEWEKKKLSDVAPCRCRPCHTLVFEHCVNISSICLSSWHWRSECHDRSLSVSFYFLSFSSNECDNQLYLVTVHLVLLCQSRISVVVLFCFLNVCQLSMYFLSLSFQKCIFTVHPRTYRQQSHPDTSFSHRLAVVLLLHVSLSSVCFLLERCGIVYPRVPLGFDWIIFLGIRFLSFGLEEQSYDEQLSVSVALSWGIRVPCASSPGSQWGVELHPGRPGPLCGSSSLLSAHCSVCFFFSLISDQFIWNSPSSSELIGDFIRSLSQKVMQSHKYFGPF